MRSSLVDHPSHLLGTKWRDALVQTESRHNGDIGVLLWPPSGVAHPPKEATPRAIPIAIGQLMVGFARRHYRFVTGSGQGRRHWDLHCCGVHELAGFLFVIVTGPQNTISKNLIFVNYLKVLTPNQNIGISRSGDVPPAG